MKHSKKTEADDGCYAKPLEEDPIGRVAKRSVKGVVAKPKMCRSKRPCCSL
jgi:hypothetical protein